jgi:antitoxin ParD1/3/4
MSIDIPHDYGFVIQKLIAQGRFPDESAVVVEGIRLVAMREKLHDEIQLGIDALDAGDRIAGDQVFAEARRRIQAIEKQPEN